MAGGSKPGERRGGRQKGVPNKATPALREARNAAMRDALEGGETPLDVITKVMRGNAGITERQFAAAVAAAPYVHARLSAAIIENRNPISSLTNEQLAILYAAAERLVAADISEGVGSGDSETGSGAIH